MNLSNPARGLLISIAGVLILSPDSLLIRLLMLDDFTLIFYRGLLPAITITLLLLAYYRGRFWSVIITSGIAAVVNGSLYAITNISFIYSIQKTSVANTLVILSSAPIFAAILSYFVLKENQRPITWIVALLSIIGISIIGIGSYQSDGLTGDLFGLVCAITTASSAVLVRLYKQVDLVPSVVFGSLLMTAYAWMQGSVALVTAAQFSYIAIIGIILVPLAFLCLTIAPRLTSSAEVQLVFLLEAILGPLWVWIVIDETPPINTIIGGSILLLSVAWFTYRSLKRD